MRSTRCASYLRIHALCAKTAGAWTGEDNSISDPSAMTPGLEEKGPCPRSSVVSEWRRFAPPADSLTSRLALSIVSLAQQRLRNLHLLGHADPTTVSALDGP